ncbi:MAG: hypothetical protein CMJ18_02235 [Phycisphaeraceae bacterium]|nr:hypothetical protein [Phycisphaeraceae bacterium]
MVTRSFIVAAIVCVMPSISQARLELARSGEARAVIVSPHPVTSSPKGSSAIARLSVSSPKGGVLLRETFDGPVGLTLDELGWTATRGEFVIGPGSRAGIRPQGGNEFIASASKALPAPHAITDEAPLTLEYVLTVPAGHREEGWTAVRFDTAEGKRWAIGIQNRKGARQLFDMPSEPRDAERVPVPEEAGPALDMKFVLERTRATWFWRRHGSGEPWQKITSQHTETEHPQTGEPFRITGVSLHLGTHIDNTLQDKEATREIAATKELKKYLEQVTGTRFEVVPPDDAPDDMGRILIGDTPTTRGLASDVDFDALGTDEILIRTVGKDLVLAGGQPRGIVYAITTFLQDHLGLRFWAPGAIDAPHDPDLTLPDLDERYEPPFEFRHFTGEIARTMTSRFWHRLSFDFQFDPGTHSIKKLLPKPLFVEHPEWFGYCPEDGDPNFKYSYIASLRGYEKTLETETDRTDLPLIRQFYETAKRTRRLPAHPCLHHPDATRTITENALAELEKEYPTWKYSPKVLWVTQDDGAYICECPPCKAVIEEEGSNSANWVRFVNSIAEQVEKRHPDVLVGMFAYLHSEAPPKTLKPRDNVLVYSALLRSNKRDPVEHYEKHARWLRRWGEIAKHHWVWDYDANFRNYYQPHPNYYVHPLNMRFFRALGVDGALVQAAQGKAADLAAMRAWVTAQMMWDPDRDPRPLMVEFMNGYYGPAGRWVMLYVDLMLTAVNRRSDYWLGCYKTDTTGALELEDVHLAIDILEQAARAVEGDDELSRRVWMARRHIDFAWLDRYDEFEKTAQEKGIPLGLPDPVKVVDALAPYRGEWGSFREGPRPADFYVYFDRLRERFPAR